MSVATPTILSRGKAIDPGYALLALDIRKEVNRISTARMIFLDGDAALRKFAISDTKSFELGNEIEIKLRYEGSTDKTVFKGLVVRHGVEAAKDGSTLVVEAKDASIKLTHTRKSNVFRDQSDDEIIGKIIQDAGFQKGSIPSVDPKHPEIVQYYATDWDFMLLRADVRGLVVMADDGKISLEKMAVSKSPKLVLEWGISEIYGFEIEADASSQFSSVESIGWDKKKQQLTQSAKAKAFTLSQGNQDGAKAAKAIGFDTYTLSHPVPMDPKDLQAWADARMARSRLSMIRGRITVPGSADIKPLDVVELKGIGDRFNGKALVSGIRHRLDNSVGWQTDLQFGLSSDWLCRQERIADSPAAGLIPRVSGLQVGMVDKFEEDPDKEYRLKVILPGVDEKKGAVWARLASPDAGKERGWFFRPETGDEVVVGFFNDDPAQAVVLGAMFGSKNKPPKNYSTLSKENTEKGIVTKKGVKIGFDDKKASVTIETPGANKIVIDDDAKAITISDQHNNSIKMDDSGIVLKSAKDIKIDAGGNVEIKGVKVDVK